MGRMDSRPAHGNTVVRNTSGGMTLGGFLNRSAVASSSDTVIAFCRNIHAPGIGKALARQASIPLHSQAIPWNGTIPLSGSSSATPVDEDDERRNTGIEGEAVEVASTKSLWVSVCSHWPIDRELHVSPFSSCKSPR